MLGKLKGRSFRLPKPTFGKVVAGAAVLMVLTSGTAYAAAHIGSDDIIDNSIKSRDIKNGQLKSVDVKDGGIKTADILDGTVTSADIADESITSADILDSTITSADVLNETLTNADLATDSVQATEVADNSIDAGEIVDFGLTNEDIGVLEAEVNGDGTLASSDHFGTTSTSLGTGTYQVNFGLNVSFCTPVVSQGEAGVGGAGGAIVGVTDRAGNANAFFVTTRDSAGSLINTAFHIVVVC